MRLSWKFVALLPAVALLSAGCGGINASQSISPATFLLPGVIKACPPSSTNAPVVLAEPSIQIASVR